MGYISARTGTFIFAFINVVLQIFISVFCIGVLIYWTSNRPRELQEAIAMTIIKNVVHVVMLHAFIALAFTAFLLKGLFMKKSKHVKFFFKYGVVNMCVTFLISIIIIIWLNPTTEAIIPLGFAIAICMVYSLILYMIRITYLQLEQEQIDEHTPLSGVVNNQSQP